MKTSPAAIREKIPDPNSQWQRIEDHTGTEKRERKTLKLSCPLDRGTVPDAVKRSAASDAPGLPADFCRSFCCRWGQGYWWPVIIV